MIWLRGYDGKHFIEF